MMKRLQLSVSAFVAVVATALPAAAQGRVHWSVGVRVGAPSVFVQPRPWHYYPYPTYRYSYVRPIWYEPAPVILSPAPVVLETAPAVVPVPSVVATSPRSEIVPTATVGKPAAVVANLELLRDPNEKVRADAVMELGRARVQDAVDPLTATLAGDRSPLVRDAAARALALIGSPRALSALTYAASADADRDVRRSAQFAVEVIRAK